MGVLAWISEGDGWLFLLIANIVLIAAQAQWMIRMQVHVYRLQAKHQGLAERLQYAIDKADRAHTQVRNMTERIEAVVGEELDEAKVRIHDRILPPEPPAPSDNTLIREKKSEDGG